MPEPKPKPEPAPSLLGRFLKQRPQARDRLARAVGSLLIASLAGFAAIGVLVIWHLVRRGRLIRERLHSPRAVRLSAAEPNEPPDVEETSAGPDDIAGDLPTS
jgi:hypothetical protein